MIEFKNTNNYKSTNLDNLLKKEYIKSLKDEKFKKLVNKLKITEEVGMKYTSKLEHTICDFKNCEGCKGLVECKNEVVGCVYYPKKEEDKLEFNYVTCKYKNKQIEEENRNKSILFGESDYIKNATMSDIYLDDKNRVELIKYITNFYHEYPNTKKGLYLHGSFGSGKTYIIAALLNELARKNYKTMIMYYPEILNKLKSTFDTKESFNDTLESIKKVDILLIDDIGAETVTTWSRDEILGTILQYRMEQNLSTFFTSNLTLEELEIHLSLAKNNTDKVKARRIIERIKQLTNNIELISKNRRN